MARKDKHLSKQQEEFISHLVKGDSQRTAYKKAYPNSHKWKDETIDNRASKLFHQNEIITRYNELRTRLTKELEDECIIDAKEILKEYKKIAFSDIKDFLKYETKINMVNIGSYEVPRVTQVIEMKNSDEVDGTVIQEVSISQKGVFSFKLHNKLKALDKLAEYVGLIKPEGEEDSQKDDGLGKQLEKLASSNIWEGLEDDSTDE